ncbi:hypothetical protein [Brevundimonas sp.]|uniref:hypothetical protein n=1 Tax=Brevundimonas sp. TaxID=1871086 RepID=UPI0035B00581
MARSASKLTETVSEADLARLDEARRRLRLELLMSWGALREAAGGIEAKLAELVGAHSQLAL